MCVLDREQTDNTISFIRESITSWLQSPSSSAIIHSAYLGVRREPATSVLFNGL